MFNGRHFERSVILLCVRWYLAYNLSLVRAQSHTVTCRTFEILAA